MPSFIGEMVFVIQNTQNRDSGAIHVKLDELIRTLRGAHNALLDLEELDEESIERLRANYKKLAAVAREDLDDLVDAAQTAKKKKN